MPRQEGAAAVWPDRKPRGDPEKEAMAEASSAEQARKERHAKLRSMGWVRMEETQDLRCEECTDFWGAGEGKHPKKCIACRMKKLSEEGWSKAEGIESAKKVDVHVPELKEEERWRQELRQQAREQGKTLTPEEEQQKLDECWAKTVLQAAGQVGKDPRKPATHWGGLPIPLALVKLKGVTDVNWVEAESFKEEKWVRLTVDAGNKTYATLWQRTNMYDRVIGSPNWNEEHVGDCVEAALAMHLLMTEGKMP